MNTTLNNDLKIVGFDATKFATEPYIYRIVMVEQDPTGRIDPFISKGGMGEVFIKENDDTYFSVDVLQTGNYLMSVDDLENDSSKVFKTIFSNIGFKEAIIYLSLDFIGPHFLNCLRKYAEKNDMRFYILSRRVLPTKYSSVADFCCQYCPDGELVVTINKNGPTTNVLNRRLQIS